MKNKFTDDVIGRWVSNSAAFSPEANRYFVSTSLNASQSESTVSDVNAKKKLRIIEAPATGAVQAKSTDEELRARFEKDFLERLDVDHFEPGIKSSTEHYVEQWLASNPMLVQTAIGKLYLSNTARINRLVGILTVVAHLDRVALSPANELVALAAMSHSSIQVKEYALRAYEYWEDAELVEKLKYYTLHPQWLEDYKNEIIEDVMGADDVLSRS